jgi:integrase-like protein
VGVTGEVAKRGFVCAGRGAQPGRGGRLGIGEFGQPGAQQVIVGVSEEQGVLQPGVGELVAAGVGNAADDPYVESFNGRVRDELLNVEEFGSLTEAQVLVQAWRTEYNSYRPTNAPASCSMRCRWRYGGENAPASPSPMD